MIDLTRKMEMGMPVYPGDPFFQSRVVADHNEDGYRVSELTFGSHAGTHLDAPFHAFTDGETLDSFPVDHFFLPSVLIDLTLSLSRPSPVEKGDEMEEGLSAPFPALITPETLAPFAPVFESVPSVILRTGWSDYWGTELFYERFPSLLPTSAEWIAEFPIRIFGMETPSLSSLANFAFSEEASEIMGGGVTEETFLHSDQIAHRTFLGRTPPVLLLEGLTNLDKLPAVTPETVGNYRDFLFTLACFPLPWNRSDASPVRAVAIFDKDFPIRSGTGR